MDQIQREQIAASIEHFRLPLYHEIPDVGLYLEQTAKYISDYLAPLQDTPVTGSMISNYVKKGLIPSPVRKQYNREQIAQLFFIAVAKMSMSMDDLHLMLTIQRQTYSSEIAYNYFCKEFENMLICVFNRKSEMDVVGVDATDEKIMLRNMIIAVAHKVYLDKLFSVLRAGNTDSKNSKSSK